LAKVVLSCLGGFLLGLVMVLTYSSEVNLYDKMEKLSSTLVIKIGSSTIIDKESGFIALGNLSRLVEKVCELTRKGHKVVIVSSGAVGVGLRRFNLSQRPEQLSKVQAAAAVGQGRLMRIYDDLFSQFNQMIAQVLLTRNDISQRGQYLNGKNTLKELLNMDVVPIVNENDTVMSEIKFGDNDTLSGLVAGMVEADWLFLMTDVDALYTANPRTNPNAKPIRIVEDIESLASKIDVSGAGTDLGTGGMQTKILAASLATAAGVNTVIIMGNDPENITRVLNKEDLGTIFKAQQKTIADRKWWIRHGLHSFGKIYLDTGAFNAVRKNNSLFAVWITKVEGSFHSQSAVTLIDTSTGEEVGRGIVNYSSVEIDRLKGQKSSEIESILGYIDSDCIIDRQNLALKKEVSEK